jgi:hypothetical protein
MGAVYLTEGFWVLSNTPKAAQEVKAVVDDIAKFNGTATAFISQDLDENQRGRLQAKLLAARDEEYAELQGQIGRFMQHVEHATSSERFTFAEVEELEEEISKLEGWFEEIKSRDLLVSAQSGVNSSLLGVARQKLQSFTEQAFAESGDSVAPSPDLS